MSKVINPARVDFVTLRLFCAVAQTGSITKGARACHLALSAASRRLSEFEAATGTRLLERTAQGIALTPAGHAAIQHARRLFHGFEQLSFELSEFSSGVRGQVRLWANMSSLTEFLPGELSRFMSRYPNIRVEVEEQLSSDIVRALIEEMADIGVFADGMPTYGLEVAPFRADQLVVLCAKTHALARHKRIAFADCLGHDFVGLNRGSSLLELTSRAAEHVGTGLRLRVQVRSFNAMLPLIATNLGIGVVPYAACQAQASALGLRILRLTDAWANRQLVVGVRTGRALSAPARLLWEQLKYQAAEPTRAGKQRVD